MAGRGSAPGERRGGRVKGVPNKKTVARVLQTHRLVEEVHQPGAVNPLGVMLENLTFYHQSAVALTEKLQAAAEILTPEMIAAGGEAIMEVLKLINKVGDFRMKSQACAVDAAPYVHPRLASVEFKGNPDNPIEHVHKLMSPREAAEAYASARDAIPV